MRGGIIEVKAVFSGIVQQLGRVEQIQTGGLTFQADLEDLELGESIAVNGVCLTVACAEGASFTADVMPETMRRTTLGALQPGDQVNVERSLRAGERIGGHMVMGHVDGTGRVVALRDDASARWVTVETSPGIIALLAVKGSVALDGISLTVVDVFESAFTVSLIPHTMRSTNAGSWELGCGVNIEVDVVARYVQRQLHGDRAAVEV